MANGFRDGLLYINEKNKEVKLCNFFPSVTDVKSYKKEGSTEYDVTLILQYDNDTTSKQICSNLKQLSNFDWEDFDIKANIFVSKKKASSIFYKIIRVQIQNMDIHAVPYFDKMGWTTYKNKPAYVAGYIVITANGVLDRSKYHISPELQNLNFDFNPKINKIDSIYYFFDLLKLNSNSLVLGMTQITSLLYSFFEEAGHTPCFTTYCVGKSQTKKTTLVRLICTLYNRSKSSGAGIKDLVSSSAALEKETQNHSDCCFILDDLHPSECKAEMRHREERLSERIRVAGNHSERLTQHSTSIAAKCMQIATAEYTLQSYSTNARCVILHFDNPVDNEELSYLQEDLGALCTFVLHFLQWAAINKTEIINSVQQKIGDNNFIGHGLSPRLAETECFLAASLDIFLDYVDSIKVNVDIKKFKRSAMSQIHKILIRQEAEMERLRNINDPEAMFQVIAKAYSEGRFSESKPSNIIELGCGNYNGYVYLNPDYALKLVQNALNNFDLTKNALDKALRSLGVLSTDCSGKMTKKLCGKRMLVIALEKFMVNFPFNDKFSCNPYKTFLENRSYPHSNLIETESFDSEFSHKRSLVRPKYKLPRFRH